MSFFFPYVLTRHIRTRTHTQSKQCINIQNSHLVNVCLKQLVHSLIIPSASPFSNCTKVGNAFLMPRPTPTSLPTPPKKHCNKAQSNVHIYIEV